MTPIDLTPTLTPPGRATWLAIGELERLIGHDEWAVVGGQMVAIHAARLGVTPARPTTDGDIVVDVRAHGRSAMRRVADSLLALGFIVRISPEGVTRFVRGSAHVDLLAPDGVGGEVITSPPGHAVQAPARLRRSNAPRQPSFKSMASRSSSAHPRSSEQSSRRQPPTRFRELETNGCATSRTSPSSSP